MNLIKLVAITLISFAGITYAQSDLDTYYALEQEVAELNADFRNNQELISTHNTTSNHFWSPSSTKNILDRLHKDQDRILKELEPKVEKMRSLEESLKVKAWTLRFGNLEQVNTILGGVASNNTCSAQGQQLFTSDEAFEAWNAQNGDVDKKVAYYAAKNRHISNCLASKNEGDRANVNESWSSLCKRVDWLPDRKQGASKAYRLKKENGKIVLSANLYFSFKGDEKDREEAFNRLQDAKPCMANFFAKHGIKLDVTFHEETGLKDWWSCDHSINLHTNTERANSANWSTHGAANPSMNDSNRCALYLHELGHLVGLPDTYTDPDCPDRKHIGPHDDIMNGGSYSTVETKKLYPSAIEKILVPLCGE